MGSENTGYSIPPNGWVASIITCPAGKKVVGGGGESPLTVEGGLSIVSSFPETPAEWIVWWQNLGTTTSSPTLVFRGWAICITAN